MRYVTTQIGIYDREVEDYVDMYDVADLLNQYDHIVSNGIYDEKTKKYVDVYNIADILNQYDYIVGQYAQHHRLCKLAGGHGTCTCGLHERLDQLEEKPYTGGQYGTG